MTSILTERRQREEDLDVVVRYIKEDLFAKVKFLYDPKADLAVDGRIYKDYKSKCTNKVGGSGSATGEHLVYVEGIWVTAITMHLQKTALAQKRSAVYTVMQNKFGGE